MEIYDFEIRRWTKEFDNIRKVLQTSANFVRWYTPTKRILNLLPPVRDGYFLCTFILKFEHREKPTFFLGYYKMSGCYDALDSVIRASVVNAKTTKVMKTWKRYSCNWQNRQKKHTI